MNDEFYPGFIGNGSDFSQEVDEVGAKFLGIDVAVSVECFLELL